MTPEQELRLLRRRVRALEALAAAYRTSSHPTEKTLHELDATEAVKP